MSATNAATIAAIPPEYITQPVRDTYAARAAAGEDVYAYCGVATWIVWDGAIAPHEERRIVLSRRDGVACGCCGAPPTRCDCGAWRCDQSGHCLGHCHCGGHR